MLKDPDAKRGLFRKRASSPFDKIVRWRTVRKNGPEPKWQKDLKKGLGKEVRGGVRELKKGLKDIYNQ
jgi:hypothetical protein